MPVQRSSNSGPFRSKSSRVESFGLDLAVAGTSFETIFTRILAFRLPISLFAVVKFQ